MTPDQAVIVLGAAVLIVAAQIAVSARHGWVSPVAFYMTLWSTNLVAYWFMLTFADWAPSISHYWIFRPASDHEAVLVAGMALTFSGIGLLAAFTGQAAIDRFAPNAAQGSALAASRIEAFNRQLADKGAAYIFWPLVAMAGLAVTHILDGDWSAIWYHEEYLQARGVDGFGIDTTPGYLFHSLDMVIGVAAGLLLAVACQARKPVSALLAGFVLGYIALLGIGNHSRIAAAVVGFSAFAFLYLHTGKGVSKAGVGLLLLSAVLYVGALVGRSFPFHGFSAYALIFQAAQIMEFTLFEFAVITLNTVLPTGPTIAHSCDQAIGMTHGYQIGSLLPGMSALDGYEIERFHLRPRITVHAPMSAYGEICHFDPGYRIGFGVLIGLSLLVLQVFWITSPGSTRIMLIAPAYLGFMMQHIYQMRTPNRMMLISVFLALMILGIRIWQDQQKRNRAASGQAFFDRVRPS